MDQEEKEYIDKKMDEMYSKLTNPDPELIKSRSKIYYKYYLKWILIAAVLVFATMLISFKFLGLI